jgi:hypothetical protein
MATKTLYIGCAHGLWTVFLGPEPGGDHKAYNYRDRDFEETYLAAEALAVRYQGRPWKSFKLPDSLTK